MTPEKARRRLLLLTMLLYSLVVLVGLFLPLIVRQFTWQSTGRLIEISIPALAAYFGFALNFLRAPRDLVLKTDPKLLGYVVYGPVLVAATLVAGLFFAFTLSNSPSAEPGVGITPDMFHALLAGILALLGTTTSLLATWLFQPASTN